MAKPSKPAAPAPAHTHESAKMMQKGAQPAADMASAKMPMGTMTSMMDCGGKGK